MNIYQHFNIQKNEISWTQKKTCAYMCSVAVNTPLIWVKSIALFKTIPFRSRDRQIYIYIYIYIYIFIYTHTPNIQHTRAAVHRCCAEQ